MNKLSKQQIHHIANLARLELTDEELETYGSQLSDVLSYIDQLREVDVSAVAPTAQTAGLENIFREDKIEEWDKEEARVALGQAPDMEDGQVKVKRVIE